MGLIRGTAAVVVLLFPSVPVIARAEPGYPACVHPYPCGDEWPDGLEGPFGLKSVTQVDVPSHDGVLLHGWIGLPDVPSGVRVPVAANSDPYLGTCAPNALGCIGTPSEPGWWADPPTATGTPPGMFVESDIRGYHVPPIELIKRGIAVAYFNVRGTGDSGGCFEFHANANERKDQRVLVDWLAAQDWSNGRVALGGHSYGGMTALEAAVENPPALKTIFASGVVADPYLLTVTPQGAYFTPVGVTGPMATTDYNFDPRQHDARLRWGPVQIDAAGPSTNDPRHWPATTERCSRSYVAQQRALEAPLLGIDRDAAFWNERRLLDRFGNITTSMLIQQSVVDIVVGPWQTEPMWRSATEAPKWLIQGQWDHCAPPGVDCENIKGDPDWAFDPTWKPSLWREVILAWLDFWLWGKGELPEHVGHVTYQEPDGAWHVTSSWPPAESRPEVLYLGATLSPAAGDDDFDVRILPDALHAVTQPATYSQGIPVHEAYPELCSEATAGSARIGLGSISDPLEEEAFIAGEPFAYLKVRSDARSGVIGLHVLAVDPGFRCASPDWSLVEQISAGAADLRFLDENFFPADFPIGDEQVVRVELSGVVRRIPAGHRLAVTVGAPPPGRWGGAPAEYPTLTLLADGGPESSHVVLPFVDGTLGGSEPTLVYPARPFASPG